LTAKPADAKLNAGADELAGRINPPVDEALTDGRAGLGVSHEAHLSTPALFLIMHTPHPHTPASGFLTAKPAEAKLNAGAKVLVGKVNPVDEALVDGMAGLGVSHEAHLSTPALFLIMQTPHSHTPASGFLTANPADAKLKAGAEVLVGKENTVVGALVCDTSLTFSTLGVSHATQATASNAFGTRQILHFPCLPGLLTTGIGSVFSVTLLLYKKMTPHTLFLLRHFTRLRHTFTV
jgi:hypothetical protein